MAHWRWKATPAANQIASTSGEVRLSHSIADGARLHTLNAMVRARGADRRYGGTVFFDFGPYRMNDRVFIPEPQLNFGAQIDDQVEQITSGIAHGLRWKTVGEISAGIQKTSYGKRITFPAAPAVRDRATPWLWNATLALNVSHHQPVQRLWLSRSRRRRLRPHPGGALQISA